VVAIGILERGERAIAVSPGIQAAGLAVGADVVNLVTLIPASAILSKWGWLSSICKIEREPGSKMDAET
jgi:hypothetical protein